jgi:mannose-6-phosphate isomerase-like protein (cupin superfamily)
MTDDGIVITRMDSVAERPLHSITVDHDQGWARFLINDEASKGSDLWLSVLRMEANQYHPLHCHPNVGEIYFILDGRCEIRVGDRREQVERGTAIYTPKGIAHSLRTGDEGVTVLIIFPEGKLDNIGRVFLE